MYVDRFGFVPVRGGDAGVLATSAGYRLGNGEISFGVDAVVTTVGRVRTSDPVSSVGRG